MFLTIFIFWQDTWQIVFLDHKLGKIYTLNKIASKIWNFLTITRKIEEVTSFINSNYDINDSKKDIEDILQKMFELGLVTISVDK